MLFFYIKYVFDWCTYKIAYKGFLHSKSIYMGEGGRVNKLQKRNYKTLDGPELQREFLSFFLSSSYRLEIVFHYE